MADVRDKVSKRLLEHLRAAPADKRKAMLEGFIEDQVLNILHWDGSRRADANEGFVEIGLDSIMAIELMFWLQESFGYVSDVEDMPEFELTSVPALAEFLLANRLDLGQPARG